jgi:transcription antitermination protein NusB
MTGQRRKARALALQVLYEADLVRHDWETILARRQKETELPEETLGYAEELISGVHKNKDNIDGIIRKFATLWPIEQISVVGRNILRIAIFEILIDNRIPFRVSINEAIELAKDFGGEGSARFVSGVLGSAVREHGTGFRKEANASGNSL